MSDASRFRRTIPTPSMSPRPATSLRTTGPTCSAAAMAAGPGNPSATSFPASEITRVVRADPVRPGLLFVGTETGIYVSLDDGQSWMRMPGGLPVVPVYDLKIKGSDLVAGTHGRSFWILDDISPLRALADGSAGTRLFAPRTTIRTRLHFGALGGVRAPISFAITFGIGGGIATTERPDGTKSARASRCRREPTERRDRLLLAGRRCIRAGHPHLPRRDRCDHRDAAQ